MFDGTCHSGVPLVTSLPDVDHGLFRTSCTPPVFEEALGSC